MGASSLSSERACAIYDRVTMGNSLSVHSGVTANLFRSANLFRRNLFASGSVPDFQKISGFVPGGQRSMFL